MKKRIISLLLCAALFASLLPLGVFTAAADEEVANGDGSSWEKAFVATTAAELQAEFNRKRTSGTRFFIKLGADITFTKSDKDSENHLLYARSGPQIDLDLCGYTLQYTSDWSGGSFITGAFTWVCIYDSQRYDSSKGEWISGVVKTTGLWSSLEGMIGVYGGTFINTRKSTSMNPCCVYTGCRLHMYAGTFEAECPIQFTSWG